MENKSMLSPLGIFLKIPPISRGALYLFFFGIGGICQATVCGDGNIGYVVKDGQVYYVDVDKSANDSDVIQKTVMRLVKEADEKSFNAIPPVNPTKDVCEIVSSALHYYGKDSTHVFFKGNLMKSADPRSFRYFRYPYMQDDARIYFEGKPISQSVSHFRLIDVNRSSYYATDGENYYFKDKIIEGRNFEFIPNGNGYAKTDSGIYDQGKKVVAADPKTFEVLRPFLGYARDENHVFYNDEILINADPKTFVLVSGSPLFYKDRRAVYLRGQSGYKLDPSTVRVSEGGGYAIDRYGVYAIKYDDENRSSTLESLNRDPDSFQELQPPWTKDKNGVYYEDSIFYPADIQTFHAIGISLAEDKLYRYFERNKSCKFKDDGNEKIPFCDTKFNISK